MKPTCPLLAIVIVLGTACGGAPGADGEQIGSSAQDLVTCAAGATVKGVDVSTYQGTVNWSSVHAAGYDFAFARVSDGTTTPDDTFATNWKGIKAAGMVRGVYQFFRGSEDPTAQANLLVSAVGTFSPGDLPPVADVEVMDGVSGATLIANLATWVSVIKAKTGLTPMIYASPGFWNALPSVSQFASELSWVADWGPSCPTMSTPWTNWAFWQTADNGSVSGISGAVDLDEYNGSLAQLQALGGPAPYAAQYVSQSFPPASTALAMTAGETIPSYIELKNVGSKAWDASTHLATTGPRDRASVFADSSWISPNRLAAVKGTVPPGGTYKFTFNLHAPAKAATYDEHFGVVEDGVAWFSDPGQGGPADTLLEAQIKVTAAPPGADAGAKQDAGPSEPGPSAGEDSGASSAPPPGTLPPANPGSSADGGAQATPTSDAPTTHAGGCAIGKGPRTTGMWGAVAAFLAAAALLRRRATPTAKKLAS